MESLSDEISDIQPFEMSFSEEGHITQVMSNLLDLRRNGEFCDLTLKVGNSELSVHKVVLVASSSYFNAMFRANMSEKHKKTIDIKGVECEALELLLDYSYTGKITITKNNVEDLLLAADLFGFTMAKQSCEKFLEIQLEPTNCFHILDLGEKYSCNTLRNEAQLFINEKFKTVMKNDEILNLDINQLKNLIESDNLNIDSEYEIFELIIKWVSEDIENNRKWLSPLLSLVRLSFIPPKQLKEISEHHLIKGDIFAQDVIEEAKICHAECAGISMRNTCATWLYVFGGEKSFMKETRSVEYFNCKGMEWQDSRKMLGGRVSFAVCILKNKLYIIGGCKQGNKLQTVQCYHPKSSTWESVASLSKCQGDVKATVLNGKIYVAGGAAAGQPTCSYVEKYCALVDKWHVVCNMTQKRRRFGLVTLNSSIYAIGGFDDLKGFLSSGEHHDASSNHWSPITAMCYSRGDFGVVELSGCIYAVGGVNELQGSMSFVEKYNVAQDMWSVISSMKSCRGGLATAVYCGKIFAINGMNEYMSIVDSVECYDETTDTWKSVASTKTARFGAAAVVHP